MNSITSRKEILFLLFSIFLSCSGDRTDSAQPEPNPVVTPTNVTLTVYRSEYEKVGDIIYDLNSDAEGKSTYAITEGNANQNFEINASTGVITVKNTIQDQFNTVSQIPLTVKISNTNYKITVVDAFDYYISNLPSDAKILKSDNEKTIDANSKWTAINNLWGKGNAVPNVDFRIATIHLPNLPNGTVLIWDVPSTASDFGGDSVWCYNNVFWGNRKGVREDLSGFPFQISKIKNLNLDFNFEQLFGNDQFKIAMNMFMTDESQLTNFSNNDGDFFFVFDQKDNFIPNYSNSLPDITIGGKPFAVRYDLNTSNNYERRRVIIKNNEKYMSGNLDINQLFKMFIDNNFLKSSQYIYHIQFGVEVTSGWGAIRFNQLNMNYEKL